MSKFKKLSKEAERLGITVRLVRTVDGADACCFPDSKEIHIRKKNSSKMRLYFLAHEMGHVHFNHSTMYLDRAIKNEKAADDYSVELAKKFGFYSLHFRAYIERRRKMTSSEEYKEFLLWYGYRKRVRRA